MSSLLNRTTASCEHPCSFSPITKIFQKLICLWYFRFLFSNAYFPNNLISHTPIDHFTSNLKWANKRLRHPLKAPVSSSYMYIYTHVWLIYLYILCNIVHSIYLIYIYTVYVCVCVYIYYVYNYFFFSFFSPAFCFNRFYTIVSWPPFQ